jgi:phosphate butyryltransferase
MPPAGELPDAMSIAATDTHAACKLAVDMARTGDVRAIMKGNVHSDEILGATVKKDGGLRTEKRISHVFVMDAPSLDRMLFISDAAVNIAPDLATKVHIVQNAIHLARACGVLLPEGWHIIGGGERLTLPCRQQWTLLFRKNGGSWSDYGWVG